MTPRSIQVPTFQACNDAEGDGEDHGDHERRCRQRERRLESLADQLRHRQVREDGDPQITTQHAPEPAAEAPQERLVEPELVMDARNILGRRDVTGDHRGGIARGDVEQREDEDRDHPHDRDGREKTANDIGEHSLGRARRAHFFSTFHIRTIGATMTPLRLLRKAVGMTN
jgi:hypothetical protein